MADQDNRHGSWWTTVPGILTALAAVITATGGLIVVLTQNGFFESNDRQPTGASVGAVSPVSAETNPRTVAPTGSTSEQRPQTVSRSPADVVTDLRGRHFEGAVITLSDDSVVSVQPSAFSAFSLKNGQSINYDRIRSVEVRQPWNGRLLFNLLNGQQLEGEIRLPPYFYGKNELGDYIGNWANIERIDFLRPEK
jgi:hypothetical protein